MKPSLTKLRVTKIVGNEVVFNNGKVYEPIPNFYDLRNFKLTRKEFVICFKARILLLRFNKKRAYYKKYGTNQYEAAKHLATELQMFLMERGEI